LLGSQGQGCADALMKVLLESGIISDKIFGLEAFLKDLVLPNVLKVI
jgi:hypothetical protein